MINVDNSISNVLNLDPSNIEEAEMQLPAVVVPHVQNPDERQIEDDADFTRSNMRDLIEKGTGALDEMLIIADQSQNARAYEVIATLLKTLVEANKDLMTVHESKQRLRTKDTEKPAGVTNNNLFVGSTSELARKLLKQ